jgi:23S rRNA pseudouridine2605 synthase
MTETVAAEPIRLNKYIAQRLAIGRRQADVLIERGRVTINGQKPQLGGRVDPTKDTVQVDEHVLEPQTSQNFVYIILNKPVGYVCSRRQQGLAPTIYSLLPQKYQHLKPVGRLDKDSSGILLMTNDGQLAFKLTHPGFQKNKQYEVLLDRSLRQDHQESVNQGVELEDGSSKLQLQRLNNNKNWLITMHEGRNRQIRRTFRALGYEVKTLHRINFGNYSLDGLKTGGYKIVDLPHEV